MEAVPLQLRTQADIGKLPEWVNNRTFLTGMMRWSGSPETSYKLSLIGLAYATASRRPPKWQSNGTSASTGLRPHLRNETDVRFPLSFADHSRAGGVHAQFKPSRPVPADISGDTLIVFRLAAALAAPALVIAAPAAAQDLAQVQQHLRAVTTMTANFSQTDRAGKTLTGTLSLKRPGKVRFQYQKGVPQLIVADGNSLYFIDYQVRQVQRWPVGNSPLSVLLDPSKDMSRFARIVPSGDPRIVSVEAHDPKHPEYGRITLIFAKEASAPAGLMLQGWVALDSQNNRTTIRLSDQRFNQPVSDGTFRWNDPRRSRPAGR